MGMNCGTKARVGLALLLCIQAGAAAAMAPDREEAGCRQRLRIIGSALSAFAREHGHLPDQLSELVPSYLPDKSVLHCPADRTGGEPGHPEAHADPRLPVSYSYEFSADPSHGLAQPLGPFPEPDIPGAGWGSCRLVGLHQRTFFGDAVPVVRCYHHRKEEDSHVLNLTLEQRVYISKMDWEAEPGAVTHALMEILQDLATGAPALHKRWFLDRFENYASRWLNSPSKEKVRPLLANAAHKFANIAPTLAGREQMTAYRLAASFYNAVGQFAPTVALAEGGHLTSTITIIDAYCGLQHYKDAERILLQAVDREPRNAYFKERLGDVYEASGDQERAAEWRLKADPAQQMVGKKAPRFTLSTLDGQETSIETLTRGSKAVLINFWFCHCGACREEFPHLQKLYEELKGKGLDILAINEIDSRQDVQSFASRSGFSFRIGIGGSTAAGGSNESIAALYRVSAYPTSFLVTPDGSIVWRTVGFGATTMESLRGALASLGVR